MASRMSVHLQASLWCRRCLVLRFLHYLTPLVDCLRVLLMFTRGCISQTCVENLVCPVSRNPRYFGSSGGFSVYNSTRLYASPSLQNCRADIPSQVLDLGRVAASVNRKFAIHNKLSCVGIDDDQIRYASTLTREQAFKPASGQKGAGVYSTRRYSL